MFLREIRIRNYSIHRDSTLRLSPLTVLVGPNGGGKSAIFEALVNFSMISRGNLRQAFNRYPFSFRATLHRGAPFVICEAWNGEDRDFIHQVKVVQGRSQIRRFSDVIAQQVVPLGKDSEGKRTHLGLKTAEEVMGGRFS